MTPMCARGRLLAPVVLVIVLFLGEQTSLRAQGNPGQETRTAAAPADTAQPLSAQSALFRSLVLPGWGQTYVGAHGRGAFYFALESGSLWMVYKSSRALSAARRLESEMRENGALGPQQRLPLAESRAQQVEDWITLSIFWALFAGADAYVSAQLADFAGHVGAAPGPAGEMRLQLHMDVGSVR